ncbi:ImmA/IrrE family metallo-endopeptidase [Flavobacterium sp. WW92]|uniref:ImmA/IrrE family metallo-endopeptidase n=1 Tax=unclassified Flavobacterium TaxID=196869 RepID=UPI002224BB41|nr:MULTISPECIES: ImmA/IrrE family metallo-endopeptidase [unclassified Flavobacterium]WDO13956.1 ImmA/IrrE family metallo-endopeptidase [Flavobacterium sp. WW92]
MKQNIVSLAKDFRHMAAIKNDIPYDIMGAVSLVMPIDIICLSDLSISKIKKWLNNRNILFNTETNDRYLHGFIITFKGTGFIFVNGTDSEDERRFTIAHETSHFILDYKLKRDKALKKFGLGILDVLDGYREPTITEKIDGILFSVDVKPFTHLIEKSADGSFESLEIFNSENDADRLALELLAPSLQVIKKVKAIKSSLSFNEFNKHCFEILINEYRLPDNIAKNYSLQLSYKETGGPSIMSKLGF